jgi:hypothetical protein
MLLCRTRVPLLAKYLGIAFHLLLLPVVERFPAAEFVRMAGYTWLLFDTVLGGLFHVMK